MVSIWLGGDKACVSSQGNSVLLGLRERVEHTEGVKCADDAARSWAKGIVVQILVLEAVHGVVGARIWVGTVVGTLPSHRWPRERPLSGRKDIVSDPVFVAGLARRARSGG